MRSFASLPLWFGGLLFVAPVVSFSVFGALLADRFIPHQVLAVHNNDAGFIYAVIGVIEAVLLAFLAIGVWERFQTAEQRVHEEASQVSVLYKRADVFSEVHGIREELKQYAETVIHVEWPKMARGERSVDAGPILERIAYHVRHLPVNSMAEQNTQSSMFESLSVIERDRVNRLLMSAGGLDGFLWTVLWTGTIVTVGFTFLFAFENVPLQLAMIGALAFALALVLFLIASLDHPFQGQVSVTPEAFHNALRNFEQIETVPGYQSK
jgi:hypothetical protein